MAAASVHPVYLQLPSSVLACAAKLSARVSVQPILEIDTDDVVCTHGATVTDLDDEMIFYLQARGLSRGQARSLLLEGWARDALATVPSEGCTSRAALKAATLAKELRAVRRDALSSI